MRITIEAECGDKTCAAAPWKYCRFVRTSHFGTRHHCVAFVEMTSTQKPHPVDVAMSQLVSRDAPFESALAEREADRRDWAETAAKLNARAETAEAALAAAREENERLREIIPVVDLDKAGEPTPLLLELMEKYRIRSATPAMDAGREALEYIVSRWCKQIGPPDPVWHLMHDVHMMRPEGCVEYVIERCAVLLTADGPDAVEEVEK